MAGKHSKGYNDEVPKAFQKNDEEMENTMKKDNKRNNKKTKKGKKKGLKTFGKVVLVLVIILVILLDKKLLIQLPNHMEKVVIIIEILNKIIFATYEILVFFKPYVIPIPS